VTESINIRSLQHYLYCPHRWGLIEIGDCWAENYFVVKANLQHNRVHSKDKSYTSRGKKVLTAVTVWNDEPQYNLYGVTDCLELTEDTDGTEYQNKKYRFCIVEYKPTKPKDSDFHFDDALQVYAQKKCVDYVFGCDCDAVVYYADVKKRITLPFNEKQIEFEETLLNTVDSIRKCIENGIIPPRSDTQNCSGCSFKDMCMPEIKRINSVQSTIIKIIKQQQ